MQHLTAQSMIAIFGLGVCYSAHGCQPASSGRNILSVVPSFCQSLHSQHPGAQHDQQSL